MTPIGPAERLTVFIDETDQHGHRPLYTEILHRARQAGMAGATVLRGTAGFGAASHLHVERRARLFENLPAVILIVDRTEKIDAFMPIIDALVNNGMLVRQPVEVVARRGSR
jgi:PII-like signaling protein